MFPGGSPVSNGRSMGEPTLLLWDVGGVLLTNAWDREERATAATHFQLPLEELERRHAEVVEEFETGQLTLQEYLSHGLKGAEQKH